MTKKENKKATIYEVAKQADVSTATVSRVLNDSPNVADKTKEKILEVIDELGFSPQLTAQKLAAGKVQTLAVVVPSFTTPYFNEVLKGIKDKLTGTELEMILYNTGSQHKEERMERFFDRGMADAVIILSINLRDKVHRQLQATKTPTVLLNTTHPDYSYFELNDYHGGFLVGEHLAGQGFKSIGMISTALESKTTNERRRGFIDALEKYDVPVNEDYFVKGDSTKHDGFTEEVGFEAIHKMLNHGNFPEAIFCMNDTQAVGAIYALSQVGMNVPEDIAIMGYDNIKMSKYLDLTTIDQKMYSIGTGAIDCLTDMINHPERDTLHQKKFDPILVERGSTTRKGKD
ncbi:MAG TPA: LacI family DNA-binding transcriptional regulator [Balneolaceae bacterium]|nr:LacI family DNA-binding transcriptional regulator [Balneolaceae bacterium]